jgi:hypothetical protein
LKPLDIDVPLSKDRSWHFPAKTLAVFVVLGAAFWAGHSFQPVKPELPANAQCIASNQATKDAAKVFSVQLVAALDGVDAPAPDLSKVKTASLECKATKDEVTVKVEAAK